MVRLVGVDLQETNNCIRSYLYSRNWADVCKEDCEIAGINPETRSNDLTTEETIVKSSRRFRLKT
jgi:hypothetical protein